MRGFLVWKSSSIACFLQTGFFTGSDLRIYCLTLDPELELESDPDESSIFFSIILRSLLLISSESSLLNLSVFIWNLLSNFFQ